jgi:hypothetical protein
METQTLADDDYAPKLNEADRPLNDPDVPLQPAEIWSLLAEVSEHDLQDRPVLSRRTHLAPKLRTDKPPSDQCSDIGV